VSRQSPPPKDLREMVWPGAADLQGDFDQTARGFADELLCTGIHSRLTNCGSDIPVACSFYKRDKLASQTVNSFAAGKKVDKVGSSPLGRLRPPTDGMASGSGGLRYSSVVYGICDVCKSRSLPGEHRIDLASKDSIPSQTFFSRV
jgi:hypothetical protein